MKFWFCETCGKRLTEADLAEGQGRDKKLKGVFCKQCAVGVLTMEALPLTDGDARKILVHSDSASAPAHGHGRTKHSSSGQLPVVAPAGRSRHSSSGEIPIATGLKTDSSTFPKMRNPATKHSISIRRTEAPQGLLGMVLLCGAGLMLVALFLRDGGEPVPAAAKPPKPATSMPAAVTSSSSNAERPSGTRKAGTRSEPRAGAQRTGAESAAFEGGSDRRAGPSAGEPIDFAGQAPGAVESQPAMAARTDPEAEAAPAYAAFTAEYLTLLRNRDPARAAV